MKIGFIGLGAMGSAMATRLLDAGHEVNVWNRSSGKAEPLRAKGASLAASPAQAADRATVVISMVADDAALEAVTLGSNSLTEGLARGAMHVSSSTISVALAKRLEASHGDRGQVFVSATVLGRPPAAASGDLYAMLAGPLEALDPVETAVKAFSQRIFRVGEQPWQANLMKLCANFMIFSTIEQISEVFALVAKAGVSEAKVFEVLSQTFCSAPVHMNYGKLILERAFSPPGGDMHLGKKDNDLLLQAGEAFGATLPMASLLRDRFVTSMARGDAYLDFAALSRRAREDAGLE